jgi:hypothetical protein
VAGISAQGGAVHWRTISAAGEARRNETPVATAGMLIRKPVGEVLKAIVDPAFTSRFRSPAG